MGVAADFLLPVASFLWSLVHSARLLFDPSDITLFGWASLKASTIMLIMPSGSVVVLLLAICCKAGRCALIVASSACNAEIVLIWSITASASAGTLVSIAAVTISSSENIPLTFLLRLIALPNLFLKLFHVRSVTGFFFPTDGIIGEVRMVAEVGDGNLHHSVIGNCFLEVFGYHLTLL